ncbi:MAG: phosphatase PAP2 family protein [Bacteroidales bacterium]|nr:phosphatase PAP2 family protein [Bacteroidales bacterium]
MTPIIALLIKYILDLLTTSKAAKEENQFEYKGNLIQRVDAFVSDKYSRVVACLSYPITVLTFARIINSYYQLDFFSGYLLLMAMASLFCAVISLFWRISIHAYGWGAAMSIFLMKYLGLYHYPRFYIVFLLIGGGLAMASRLYLKRHTTLQVYLGYAVGLICGILIRLIYGSIF